MIQQEEKKQFPQGWLILKNALFKIEVGLNFKKLLLKEKLGV